MDDRAIAPEPAGDAERSRRVRAHRLRVRIQAAILARVSPERTRRSTMFERQTVGRLSWGAIVRCNRYLERWGRSRELWRRDVDPPERRLKLGDLDDDAPGGSRRMSG
jgi:hypothetical protein